MFVLFNIHSWNVLVNAFFLTIFKGLVIFHILSYLSMLFVDKTVKLKILRMLQSDWSKLLISRKIWNQKKNVWGKLMLILAL